jgi:single-strand DNA-binding protein
MKNIVVAGNVGKDAETRRTQSGDAVTSWSVAVEGRNGTEKTTLWFKCSLWGKRGENLAQYLTKGSRVVVSGDMDQELYDGKTYLTIRADQVSLMGGKPEGQREERRESPPAQRNAMDDEIPFNMEWRI